MLSAQRLLVLSLLPGACLAACFDGGGEYKGGGRNGGGAIVSEAGTEDPLPSRPSDAGASDAPLFFDVFVQDTGTVVLTDAGPG